MPDSAILRYRGGQGADKAGVLIGVWDEADLAAITAADVAPETD